MGSFNYSLTKVSASFAAIPLDGFGADSAIEFEKVKDDWSVRQGLDGSIVFWDEGSNLYKVTLTLIWGGTCAKALQAIRQADRITKGAGIQPLIVSDTLGTVNFVAGNSRIARGPEPKINAEPSDLVFTIMANADLDFLS